jgi:hypothetical protein
MVINSSRLPDGGSQGVDQRAICGVLGQSLKCRLILKWDQSSILQSISIE